MASVELLLGPLVRKQDGAVTVGQAYEAGVSRQQLRTLLSHGWTSPVRGVLIEPEPADLFRAGVRAGLLASPDGVACRVTAARLRALTGLPLWTSGELPQLLLPAGTRRAQRKGVRSYSGLLEPERTIWRGWPVTSLPKTLADLSFTLRLDDLVSLLDGVLNAGGELDLDQFVGPSRSRMASALALADGRAESPLETIIRLLLVRAGLAPEVLQLRLFDRDGLCYARLDLAWPSRMLAVEADGREYHDRPDALYRDRRRQNALELDGWTVLRFTWEDVLRRPQWVTQQVLRALTLRAPDTRGSGWPNAV
jgi:hypothetical protein